MRTGPRTASALWVALFVATLTTATFGVFSGQFGLYYDDYPSWYVYLTSGTRSLVDLAGGQGRPLVGLLPWLAGTVTGSHRLMWLAFTLNGLLVFSILRLLWPSQLATAALTAALVCVYPLFWLRPLHIALAVELSLLLALLSLWLCLRSLEQGGWRRAATTAGSVLLVVGYLLLYELPLGLELMRPVLVAVRLRRLERLSARHLFWSWAPWLAVLLGFIIWRLFVFRPSGDYERLRYNAVVAPGWDALVRLGHSCWNQWVGTWGYHLPKALYAEPSAWLLAGLCALAGILCLARVRDEGHPSRQLVLEMATVGLGVLLAGQFAPLLKGSVAGYQGLFSRWTHCSVLGASLLWTALLGGGARVVRRPRLGQAILLGMVGLGALCHAENARDFIRDWQRQRQLFWELTWRAPAFEPGVVLIFDRDYRNAQDRIISDYEQAMSADLFFGESQTVATSPAELSPAEGSREFELFGRVWKADFERSLLIYAGRGCVEVVAERRSLPRGKQLSRAARPFVSLSSERWIRAEPSPPPPHRFLFEPEPPRDWCYFYEQARLSEQLDDSERILRLGEEAWARGLRPELKSEWDVFREAFRRVAGREFPPGPE